MIHFLNRHFGLGSDFVFVMFV